LAGESLAAAKSANFVANVVWWVARSAVSTAWIEYGLPIASVQEARTTLGV
jgi:hypothetical protein